MKLGGFAKVLAGSRQVVTPYNPPPALTLPLKRELGESSVDGRVVFSGQRYSSARHGLDFGDLVGELRFTRNGLEAEDLNITLSGEPARVDLCIGDATEDKDAVMEGRIAGNLGMAAFYQATQELGVADRVTTFTLSDFGRTLEPSGAGSDHGWGNHHFIMGDAVQGGRLFGTFPSMALGGPDDSGSRGAMIPSTSIDQYGATLASWFGVPQAQLASVFPNLGNFATTNLGFLGV